EFRRSKAGVVVAGRLGSEAGQQVEKVSAASTVVDQRAVAFLEVEDEVVAVGEDVFRQRALKIGRARRINQGRDHKCSIFNHLAGGRRGRFSVRMRRSGTS